MAQSSLKLIPRCKRLNTASLVQLRQGFSSQSSSVQHTVPTFPAATETQWPDSRLGLLSPQDPRFPLPGNIGEVGALHQPSTQSGPAPSERVELPPSREDEIMYRLSTYVMPSTTDVEKTATESEAPPSSFQYTAHTCPVSVKRDLCELFPAVDLGRGDLTVVIVARRTVNDMSVYSSQAESERETLLEEFINTAQQKCMTLQRHGYWADFIDPSCGKPYLGSHTNATMFETDERYRHFGLTIEDLGCCKVISHPTWGTHAYVGSIFTDAPQNHPVIKNM